MKSSWNQNFCTKCVFVFLRCFKFKGGRTRTRLAGEGGAGLAAVHLHKLSGDAIQVRGAPSQDAGVAQSLPGELQHYFRLGIFFKWHISYLSGKIELLKEYIFLPMRCQNIS